MNRDYILFFYLRFFYIHPLFEDGLKVEPNFFLVSFLSFLGTFWSGRSSCFGSFSTIFGDCLEVKVDPCSILDNIYDILRVIYSRICYLSVIFFGSFEYGLKIDECSWRLCLVTFPSFSMVLDVVSVCTLLLRIFLYLLSLKLTR